MATWTSQRTGTWSDDAANASSPWNGGSNPATGVPANTDTVTIASPHVVTFNVDQSGFAAGITLAVNGTLEASTTAGAYVLKLQANMTGSGTLRAGTSGTPYPTNCTFTINRNGFEITATNLTPELHCAEPTIKYIRLSAQEAIGQTVWSVDTDVTADPAWVNGAIVRICDVNNGNDNEERTLSSATSNTITVTSGLTAQKESGAYIVLISRNVKVTHTATTGNGINGGTGGTIAAEIRNATTGINRQGATIGGTVSGCTNGLTGCHGSTVTANICGNSGTNVNSVNGATFSNCVIAGSATGMTGSGCVLSSVILAGHGTAVGSSGGGASGFAFLSCTVLGNTSGLQSGGGHKIVSSTFTNTNDLNIVVNSLLLNSILSGATEFTNYNGVNVPINNFVESFDHDATANAYRAWTKGGIIDSDTGTVYTGRTRSYKHACATASFYAFQNRTFTVQPSGGLVVQCYVRKTATMSYLPRVWILTPGQEPFITGSPAHEDIMTDSVDTWEELNLVYANGGTSPVDVVVRTVAKNASGNVFFDPIVTVLAPATYDVYNTLLANVAAILVDTNELQVDWVNGGRLDNILDARASQTSVDTIDDFLDTEIAAIISTLATIAGYLDTEIASIISGIAALPTANANADALLDRASGIETGYTPRQALRIILAAMAGKLSGADTGLPVFRDVNDTKNRISATTDANGNRSAVTLDAT